MSATPRQAHQLVQLAQAALDAVRRLDTEALAYATAANDLERGELLAALTDARTRADDAELRLMDALYALPGRP